jgi:hypothetical protein
MPQRKFGGQLEFDFERERSHDRNFSKGGRSFYFFDFDDNIMFLSTPIFLFHKKTFQEIRLSSGEFSQYSKSIGKEGRFKNYTIIDDDSEGSFRNFRDKNINVVGRLLGKKQILLNDIKEAMERPDFLWKGPSWNFFYHATLNKRPISIITARGHESNTIKKGIGEMVRLGHLPHNPNFLSVFPVCNPNTKMTLDEKGTMSVGELKRKAIRSSVELAIIKYGPSPYHRFGMSDDDPHNIEMITEEMTKLKREFPNMSFFVIKALAESLEKREIFGDHFEEYSLNRDESSYSQLSLNLH